MITSSIKNQSLVQFFSLHPSGTLLATCCSDGTAQIYGFRQSRMPLLSQFRNSRTLSLSILSDGWTNTQGEETGEEDGIWELVCELCDHIGPVYKCCWCPVSLNSLPVLVTVGADRAIFIYHFQQRSGTMPFTSENVKPPAPSSIHNPSSSTSISWTTGGSPSLLQATRWHGWKGVENDTITDVAFLPPGLEAWMVLSTASLDGCIRVYKVMHNAPLDRICVWSPDTIVNRSPTTSISTSSPCAAGVVSSSTAVRGAVTALSWFPGRAESSRTIVVGCMSGKIALARWDPKKTFEEICFSSAHACSSPVVSVAWAPPVGRRFILFAACSRHEVLIFRLHVCSPAFLGENLIDVTTENRSRVGYRNAHPLGTSCERSSRSSSLMEVFRCSSFGACGLSWNKSATILGLVSDRPTGTAAVAEMSEKTGIEDQLKKLEKHFFTSPSATSTRFLQMGDLRNHQSWKLLQQL